MTKQDKLLVLTKIITKSKNNILKSKDDRKILALEIKCACQLWGDDVYSFLTANKKLDVKDVKNKEKLINMLVQVFL